MLSIIDFIDWSGRVYCMALLHCVTFKLYLLCYILTFRIVLYSIALYCSYRIMLYILCYIVLLYLYCYITLCCVAFKLYCIALCCIYFVLNFGCNSFKPSTQNRFFFPLRLVAPQHDRLALG